MVRIWCHCGLTQLYVKCGEWTTAEGDAKVALGCCQNQCPKILSCGHRCTKTCHDGTGFDNGIRSYKAIFLFLFNIQASAVTLPPAAKRPSCSALASVVRRSGRAAGKEGRGVAGSSVTRSAIRSGRRPGPPRRRRRKGSRRQKRGSKGRSSRGTQYLIPLEIFSQSFFMPLQV